jgi:hypothetical protein
MTEVPDSVLAKVAKLLAMAEKGTEHEAAIAMGHVQRYMQDYNLSLSQIQSGGTPIEDKREKKQTGQRAMYKYQIDLMAALAELNFCVHQIHTVQAGHRRSKQHLLVGRVINVSSTTMQYEYLVTTMRRLVKEAGYAYGKEGEKNLHYWLEGCSTRLCERLYDLRRQRLAEEAEKAAQVAGNGTGRELALLDVYGSEADLNNDHMNGFPPGTTATRRLEAQRKEAEREAKRTELMAQGVEETEAFYLSYGLDPDDAKARAYSWNKKIKYRASRSTRSTSRRWTKSDDRHWEKVNSDAYQQGKATGGEISLDRQIDRKEVRRIGR